MADKSWSFPARRPALLLVLAMTQGLSQSSRAVLATPSGDEILARLESENNRRHDALKTYTGSRQYTLQNLRFGRRAAVAVLMSYRDMEGERYTIVTRSGSDKLNGIIDQLIASEVGASIPPENARHQISAANYTVRLVGVDVTAGRTCYVLALSPRIKSRFLIVGKAWVDDGSYAVVRIEGQFAASYSLLIGAPRIVEEFVDVQGFWLPGHVRSVTSSLLLGPTELDIHFSGYQLEKVAEPVPQLRGFAAAPATFSVGIASQHW